MLQRLPERAAASCVACRAPVSLALRRKWRLVQYRDRRLQPVKCAGQGTPVQTTCCQSCPWQFQGRWGLRAGVPSESACGVGMGPIHWDRIQPASTLWPGALTESQHPAGQQAAASHRLCPQGDAAQWPHFLRVPTTRVPGRCQTILILVGTAAVALGEAQARQMTTAQLGLGRGEPGSPRCGEQCDHGHGSYSRHFLPTSTEQVY